MARYGYNYFAPTPPKKLRRQVAADVNAQIAPYLTQLNKRYAAGSQMINQGTGALAASLAPAQAQTHQIYADAQARDAALNAALSQQLTGQGNQLASSLSSTLGQAGQSTSGVAGLAGIGQGAAGAGSALGAANIARLIAQGAANENYSAQLPNLARLAGAQQQQNYRGQIETQRQGILEKVPGLISSGTQQAQDREFQKAVAVESGLAKGATAAEAARGHTLTYKARIAGIKATNARAAAAAKAAANKPGTYNDNLSRSAGHAVDGAGKPIVDPSTGKPFPYVPKPTKAPKAKTLSPSQVGKQRADAITTAHNFKHGTPTIYYADGKTVKSQGKGKHPNKNVAAPKLYRALVNHGIREDIAAWAVGQTYGKWLSPGQAKQLGFR